MTLILYLLSIYFPPEVNLMFFFKIDIVLYLFGDQFEEIVFFLIYSQLRFLDGNTCSYWEIKI